MLKECERESTSTENLTRFGRWFSTGGDGLLRFPFLLLLVGGRRPSSSSSFSSLDGSFLIVASAARSVLAFDGSSASSWARTSASKASIKPRLNGNVWQATVCFRRPAHAPIKPASTYRWSLGVTFNLIY